MPSLPRFQKRRLVVVAALVACFVTLLGWRLYTLQVVQGDAYRKRADGQHTRLVNFENARGSIVDRDGGELAVSIETLTLYAHPRKVTDPDGAARELAKLIDVPRRELLRQLKADKNFVYLRRFLDLDTGEKVRALELKRFGTGGIYLEREYRRRYPHDSFAAHVVGFASIDEKGFEGIEKAQDEVLSAGKTTYLVQRDGRNQRVRLPGQPSLDETHDVVLTIDPVLQHIAERDLERAIRETGAQAASAVMLDPRTGEVLALANWPAPDANRFGGGEARVNRAIERYYEPGSTFKIVPLAAALERGRVRPEQRFDCENGLWQVGNRSIHDVSPQGVVPLTQVVAESSNIGMVKVVQTLTPEELRETVAAFGFDARTGLGLPGEVSGSLKPVSEWSSFTQASLAFGQEIGVTVLQMASAIGVIANDGVRVEPRIVLGLRDADGRLKASPEREKQRVISAATARTIRSMLEGVVAHGSGKRGQVDGYRLAGKSGTAQKAIDGRYHPDKYMASFGGFGPGHAPQLVCLVVLDSPRGEWRYGGQVAAPVFGRMMADAMRHLRIPYDDPPALRPVVDPEIRRVEQRRQRTLAQADERGRVPDLRGLGAREAVALLAGHGFLPRIEGTGQVVAQDPRPGTVLEAGEVCRVRLARSGGRSVMEARR